MADRKAPDDWALRKRDWSRKLGRLRLDAEPLAEQLDRYRRVTVALTVMPGVISLMFLALFTAFGAPLVGLVVVGVILAPITLFAWLDFARLSRRVRDYEQERRHFEIGSP
jgi:hypothetical protein